MNPAQITINPNLPGTLPSNSFSGLVANFYSFALVIAGVLAFGAIVYGGVLYATSRGNPTRESEGKSWITSALLGLLLLGGAYIILYTINPQLVNLQIPGLPTLPPSVYIPGVGVTPVTPGPPSACPLTPIAPITDPQAQAMEAAAANGQSPVLWTSSDSNVQQNLTALQAAYNQMQSALSAQGDALHVNSAYRPLAYQAHLYNIYETATQLQSNHGALGNPNCSDLIANLYQEEQRHGICYNNGPCLVASPQQCSPHTPHVLGIGIDINISGPIPLTSVNSFLQSHNIPLRWQALPKDPVHFNLQNPPYTSCASGG